MFFDDEPMDTPAADDNTDTGAVETPAEESHDGAEAEAPAAE